MSWFERHLNWTLALACVVTTAAVFATRLAWSSQTGHWMTVILAYVIPLIPCAWVIRRKSRSLWWLPAVWVPFVWWLFLTQYVFPPVPFVGWVVPLALENRRAHPSDKPQVTGVGGVMSPGSFARRPMPSVDAKCRSRIELLLRVAGIVLGLIVGGCAVALPAGLLLHTLGLLKYMMGGALRFRLEPELILNGMGISATLLLVAVLLILPQRSYAVKPYVRFLAYFTSVILAAVGLLAALATAFFFIMDSADPGHGGILVSYFAGAVAVLALLCCAVMMFRARTAAGSARGLWGVRGCSGGS